MWQALKMSFLRGGLLLFIATITSACGGDPCGDLAEVCAACADTPEGRMARQSCEAAVATEDDLTCEDRLEGDRYVPFGCPRL